METSHSKNIIDATEEELVAIAAYLLVKNIPLNIVKVEVVDFFDENIS